MLAEMRGVGEAYALVAFDLGKLPDTGGRTVKLTLVLAVVPGGRENSGIRLLYP